MNCILFIPPILYLLHAVYIGAQYPWIFNLKISGKNKFQGARITRTHQTRCAAVRGRIPNGQRLYQHRSPSDHRTVSAQRGTVQRRVFLEGSDCQKINNLNFKHHFLLSEQIRNREFCWARGNRAGANRVRQAG